jgi:hypothetical protein
MEPEVFPNGYWRWALRFGVQVRDGCCFVDMGEDLFQTQILHLLHQVLMVNLNNYLKGIASPRQNIGR